MHYNVSGLTNLEFVDYYNVFVLGSLAENLKARGLFDNRHKCENNIESGCLELVWKVWTVLVWLRIGNIGMGCCMGCS